MAALTSAASICGQRVQAVFRSAQAQQQRGALQVGGPLGRAGAGAAGEPTSPLGSGALPPSLHRDVAHARCPQLGGARAPRLAPQPAVAPPPPALPPPTAPPPRRLLRPCRCARRRRCRAPWCPPRRTRRRWWRWPRCACTPCTRSACASPPSTRRTTSSRLRRCVLTSGSHRQPARVLLLQLECRLRIPAAGACKCWLLLPRVQRVRAALAASSLHCWHMHCCRRSHIQRRCHPGGPLGQVGDVVTLAPSRPLSKSKRFTVESIVKKAQVGARDCCGSGGARAGLPFYVCLWPAWPLHRARGVSRHVAAALLRTRPAHILACPAAPANNLLPCPPVRHCSKLARLGAPVPLIFCC